MRVCIYYFSGTGNTEYVARKLQNYFNLSFNTCELVPLEELTLGRVEFIPGAYDLVGLGFPVHAMDAPRIVYQFIDLLPACPQSYFLFKTAGSKFLLGGSTYEMRLKLAQKQWKLRHESFYEMPSNIFARNNSEKTISRTQKAEVNAQIAVDEICRGTKRVLPSNTLMRIANHLNSLENEGCKHGSPNWWADENCNQCGLCVSKCPTENISWEDGAIHFSDKCIFCLRCRWICPTEAIHHRQLEHFIVNNPRNETNKP